MDGLWLKANLFLFLPHTAWPLLMTKTVSSVRNKVVTRTVHVARKPCYIGYLCQGSKQKCIHARYSDALENKVNQILTVNRYHAQEQRLLAE